MSRILATALVAATVLTGFASTTVVARETESASVTGKGDGEKKVCRYEESTGSFVRKRTCHTRSEWQVIDDAANSNARQRMDWMNRNRDMAPR